MKNSTTCNQWAEYLAVSNPQDFSPTEYEAFQMHLAECADCAATRECYRFTADRIRTLPPVKPLPDLSLHFLQARQDRVVGQGEGGDLVPSSMSVRAEHGGRFSVLRKPIERGLAVLVATLIILLALVVFHKPAKITSLGGSFYEAVIVTNNTPEGLINDFCRDMMSSDYQAAYKKYTKHLQTQMSFNNFMNFWSMNNRKRYYNYSCIYNESVYYDNNTYNAYVDADYFDGDRIKKCMIALVFKDKQWQIEEVFLF